MGILTKLAKDAAKSKLDNTIKPLTQVEKEALSSDTQKLFLRDNPDTFKEILIDDEYAQEALAYIRSPDSLEIQDPAKLEDVKSVRKEIYNLTQESLKDLPDEITVYRYGPLNEKTGLSSFTLNPNFQNPWKFLGDKDTEGLGKTPIETYTVKKADILAAPDLIRNFEEGEILIKNTAVKKNTEFNKGGTPMMEKQMELFEDGGLRDEGGMVDEESGNEVPVGSTRKEVRDDIPAMLSEGEFVFPADVVRYIGLENLMRIRQDAKQGLKQMEAMGQMGNGDEAVLPDDMPFGMMDLIIIEGEEEEEEPQEKAQGGVIHANQGSFIVPKFDPYNQDVRQFENAEGKKLNIPFLNGNPVYPIPEGYFPVGQVPEKDETEEAIPTGDDDGPTISPSEGYDWNTDTSATDGKALQEWIDNATKTSTFGNVAIGIAMGINPLLGGAMALASKQEKKQIISMLDEKIAQAKKTPIEGQVDSLEKLKQRLTTKEGKGILAKVLDEIVGTVTDALGLSKAEKATAKVGAGLGATQDPDEPDDKTTDTQQKVLNELAAKGYKLGSPDDAVPEGAFSFGSLEPKSGEEILEAVKTVPVTEFTDREEAPFITPTAPEVELEVGPAAPIAPETPEAIPTAPETPTIASDPGRIIRPVKLARLNRPADTATPDITAEEGETPSTLPLRTAQTVVGAGMTKLQTALDEIRASQPYRGGDSGMTLKEKIEDPKGTLKKSWENLTNAITEVSTTDYTPPTQPTATTVKMPSDDDDGPSFAEKMQKQMQEQAKSSLDKFDENVGEVVSKAKTKSAQKAAKQEAEKVKEKLEQQSKGIKTGFKKGGLASRKK